MPPTLQDLAARERRTNPLAGPGRRADPVEAMALDLQEGAATIGDLLERGWDLAEICDYCLAAGKLAFSRLLEVADA